MNFIDTFHCHLRQNPITGIISGFSSVGFIKVQHLLTDDQILKLVAGLGTWCSTALAILTLIVWAIKQYGRFKIAYQNKKKAI
jgi:hypothetical protein